MPEYEVVIWNTGKNGQGLCNTIWDGKDVEIAFILASHVFAKEMIEVKCIEQKLLNPWEEEIDFDYADKVKCRITVLEKIDSNKEASGEKPPIIKSFGNEAIEIFRRVHFDD